MNHNKVLRSTVLIFLFAAGGCAKSKGADAPPVAAAGDDLPSNREALNALLDEASPAEAMALKGRLRQLEGSGSLDLRRPAVVGASLSAGLGSTPLAAALDIAIPGKSKALALASTLFFRSPHSNGRTQIDEAMAANASVIFAVDLLFWYAYQVGDLEFRMRSLDEGLANLERVATPIILGDLPDMRTGEPWMLPPATVPRPEELLALNARIHTWARRRLNVHIVPLAEWSAALATDGEIRIASDEQPVSARSLMNPDGLHPNQEGLRYMFLRLDEELLVAFPDTQAAAIRFR